MQHDERPLARRIWWALLVPAFLLVAAGSVLALQFSRMMEDAAWVDHTDEVIAKAYEAQKQISDQETGLRGFLLSGDDRFLEPYNTAHPRGVLRELLKLVEDNPEQHAQTERVIERYEEWFARASPVEGKGGREAITTQEALLARKVLMDRVRVAMSELLDTEQNLRHTRSAKAQESANRARTAFVVLLGAVAAAIALFSRQQLRAVSGTYAAALESELETRRILEKEDWIRTGQMKVSEALQGDLTVDEASRRALAAVARHTGAEVGAFFVAEAGGLRRRAGFGIDASAERQTFFAHGEGLVGRAATEREPMVLRDVPSGYLQVRSGTGTHTPIEIALAPAQSTAGVDGVMELGFFRSIDGRTKELLERVGSAIAVALQSAHYRARLQELLEKSQRQAEELQAQQEELLATNTELRHQTNLLTAAQAEIEERQSELEAANVDLEDRREELERAQRDLTANAAELERANQYKSQFLANMSHELRTPLNSALILAKLLFDNQAGNLSEEQVTFARTIHSAGTDLLALIDDVLDVAKIEAGQMTVRPSKVALGDVVEPLSRMFEPMAKQKGIGFVVRVNDGAPSAIVTDAKRLHQILTNLLSNAIKFTDRGEVRLAVSGGGGNIAFEVRDTGIGIPLDQQSIVFEAFRQADGTTARKHGGTGLGLSIARELTHLLGGQLRLESEVGRGSTFVLSMPTEYRSAAVAPLSSGESARRSPTSWRSVKPVGANGTAKPLAPVVPDDRANVDRARRLLLVVEDDPAFARILVDLCHELHFQCVTTDSSEEAVRLARELLPSAILLDVNLRDHSGLSVLDRVKRDPLTRHVPVHVLSVDDRSEQAKAMGAAGYLHKPVDREELALALQSIERKLTSRLRKVLVVEDDPAQQKGVAELLGGNGVEIVSAGTVRDALESLKSSSFDCVVIDLKLPDGSGADVLDRIASDDAYSFPPIIVYTGRTLTSDEEQRLRAHASSIIVKGARAHERLLDEVTLFLHQVESELPPERRQLLKLARDRDRSLAGRNILVVEDDVRNVFALMNVFEPLGASVKIARNGREALSKLESNGVDLVLMDVMMPEMDGLEATRAIRGRPNWAKLPIIALTAKTMPDDRRRCLEAGANDFIAKPVDVDVLLSLVRVWMPR